MAQYAYQAKDSAGRSVSGHVEARNQREAAARLQEQGYYPTSLRLGKTSRSAAGPGHPLMFLLLGPSSRSMAIFYRKLASMLGAGLGLPAILRALSEDARGWKLRHALPDLLAAVDRGEPASTGMAQHPEVFPALHVALFRAGETTGRLELACNRIADEIEHRRKLWLRVLPAMVYPIGLVAISAVAQPVVLWILNGGSFLQYLRGPLLLVGQIALGLYLLHLALKLGPVATVYDTLKVSIPVMAGIVRRQCISRFFYAFADLYEAGVPVSESLAVAAEACGNRVFTGRLRRLRPLLERGEGLADTLALSGLFPRAMLDILRGGEVSGRVDTSLRKAAEYLDGEAEASMGVVMAIAPVLFWLIGAVFIILAIVSMLGVYTGQLDQYLNLDQ